MSAADGQTSAASTELDAAAYDSLWMGGFGPVPWAAVESAFAGWHAYWQAADGIRQESLPAEEPWATHLWCWSDDGSVMARIRIDRDCHVAVISADARRLQAWCDQDVVEQVDVLTLESAPSGKDDDRLVLWPDGDGRTHPLDQGIVDPRRPWSQFVTLTAAPVTFVRRG